MKNLIRISYQFQNDTMDNLNFITKSVSKLTNDMLNNIVSKEQNVCDLGVCSSPNTEISFDDSLFLKESVADTFEIEQRKQQSKNVKILPNTLNYDEITKMKEIFENEYISNTHSSSSGMMNNLEKSLSDEVLKSKHFVKDQETQLKPQPYTSEMCKLSSWGLPKAILEKYSSKKLDMMFQWQVECLNNENVLKNYKNLIYSAPTSAGKTLVAEILAIKTVFERRKKIIFIVPFVSIVREKMYYFQDLMGTSGIRVEGFMGSYSPPGGFSSVHIAICTIEKANNLINRLLEEGTLSDIGAILIDEIHLLGDSHRGYLLELLLTKLIYISKKDKNIQIQIIGMSATLPNLHTLSKWLEAELYKTNFRPIPLDENAVICGEVYDVDFKFSRKLSTLPEIPTDTDNVLQLCLETIRDSCSILIFCPTKNWCENLAKQIASAFFKIGHQQSEWGVLLRNQLNTGLIMEVLEQLRYCPVGLDDFLRKTVSFGVAFHHAGLTIDERDIIEAAFRNGTLRILVATSTLSSGVNLPARRVIIRTPMFHGKPIDILSYRQMIGRAGRMGKDTRGESFLICQKNELRIAKELMSTELKPVESCLEGAGKLKRAILEVVASGVACYLKDIDLFTKSTLLAVEGEYSDDLLNPITDAILFLKENEFIRIQKQDDGTEKYVATSLGKACLTSSMAPDEGLALFTELAKARQCFVLETELHLIYLVTPYSACHSWGTIDWMFYLDLWEKLPQTMKRVGDLVGVKESYIVHATRGKIQTNTNKLYHKLLVHKRFFIALALQDLVNEKSLGWVCAKFNCNRGMLQSLQQSASSFAGMVTSFSKQLGWISVELLISQFQDRLQFGVSRDLLDLLRLPILNGKLARTLFNGGVETVANLANSKINTIENILHRETPFESEKEQDGESEFQMKQRNKIRNIWITGKEGLTVHEVAKMLVTDAREYVKLDMGLADARWEISQKSNNESVQIDEAICQNIEKVQQDISNLTVSEKKTSSEILSFTEVANIKIKEKLENSISVQNLISSKCSEKKDISDSSSRNSSRDSTKIEDDGDSVEVSINSSLDIPINSEEHVNIERSATPLNTSFQGESQSAQEHVLSGIIMSPCSVGLDEPVPDESLFDVSSSSRLGFQESTKSFDVFSDNRITRNACFQELNNGTDSNCISGDLLTSSPTTEFLDKKRRISKIESDSKSSSKKQKIQSSDKDSETDINFSYYINKLSSDFEQADFSRLEIVDVCTESFLFNLFIKEIQKQRVIALSLACTKFEKKLPSIGINQLGEQRNDEYNGLFCGDQIKLNGFALSWGSSIAFYLPLDKTKHHAKIISLIKMLLTRQKFKVQIFDSKEQIKVLKHCTGINFSARIDDPKVADWILDPEGKEKNLQAMAMRYCPELVKLAQLVGGCKGVSSTGLDCYSPTDPKIRSSVESVLTWHLVKSLNTALNEISDRYLITYGIETETLYCLAKIELNGICVKKDVMQKLAETLKSLCNAIEKKAFSLAGRRFNFLSSTDVAKLIGLFRGRRVSTGKQILQQNDHPIADLILQWRKINSAMTKMIYPLIRKIKNDRIHGCYVTHTSTGRIIMHEPNLQNIAKDFEVVNPISKEKIIISCRKAFVVSEDHCLISADYCQLELRILAHFSGDKLLCSLLTKPGDVFKSIAARWNDVEENKVTETIRQQTKVICYGIIYGMGAKSLSAQLQISETDAAVFMETFRNTYPEIKSFITKTLKSCREKGYVETLKSRRRYLLNINGNVGPKRDQAERQAVNTVIQGSAADVVKVAMVNIEHELQEIFCKTKNKPMLVLHLHDELIYEVPSKYLNKVGKVIKKNMENSLQLSVPLPVKLKIGSSWGDMREYNL